MRTLHFTLDPAPAKDFARALKKAPEVTREELRAATLASLLLLENLTRDNTPVGVTGLARGAWSHELMGEPDVGMVLGRLYNPLPYAAPLEFGTRPHWAPLAPLIDWVRAKLDVQDDDEALQVAYAIRGKIAAQGTKGAHMASRSLQTADADIRRNYRDAQRRAFERIGL